MPEALQHADQPGLQALVGFHGPVEQVAEDDREQVPFVGDRDAMAQFRQDGLGPDGILAPAGTPRRHVRIADDEQTLAGLGIETLAGQDHAETSSIGAGGVGRGVAGLGRGVPQQPLRVDHGAAGRAEPAGVLQEGRQAGLDRPKLVRSLRQLPLGAGGGAPQA